VSIEFATLQVIMDNASFYKSQKTRELIESAGCKFIFLQPSSPDLNLIEKFWANMKSWIRNRITKCSRKAPSFNYGDIRLKRYGLRDRIILSY
jgi:transposase